MRAFVVLLVLAAAPAWADAPGHAIDDSRGEIGKKDPYAGMTYVTLPEIDLLWVDLVPRDTVLEISWRVANLSHRTFAPNLEGLNFICDWGIRKADGSPGGVKAVVAERATGNGTGFWTRFDYDHGTTDVPVEGEFDWAENTVRVRIPLSFFESGDTLVDPVAWSTATTQNRVGLHTSIYEFGDRAPDAGWGRDVTIP